MGAGCPVGAMVGIRRSPDGSKELLLEVEGVVPKAASKLGCSRLFWAGVTGDGEGAMKEPPNPASRSADADELEAA